MTLQLKKSGNYTYLYALKSFRKEDGKCTTKVVEKFGTVEELREKLNGADPIEWARAGGVGGIAPAGAYRSEVPWPQAPNSLVYYKVRKNRKSLNRNLSGLGS